MVNKLLNKRIFLTGLSLFTVVFVLSRCVNDKAKDGIVRGPDFDSYAGTQTCKSCHAEVYESHLQTLHHQTSAIATIESVKGSKEEGKNTFYFQPDLYIKVEEKEKRLFQTAYHRGIEKISRPFDFVVGSGKRGQSFLYWYDSYVFQLPLTYFAETDEWTNSPGYSNKVQFNRPVTSRCLECHATFFKKEERGDDKAERFSRSQVILGVECEKCHGPAANHVRYHEDNPGDKQPHQIVNPSNLTRTQNLDLCRMCHGGSLTKTKPSFSFVAGNKLSDFFTLDTVQKKVADIDVHGNQFGMLSASKCFTNSNMTCNTCHSPHKNETGQSIVFASKCLNCHSEGSHSQCGLVGQKDSMFLQQNCIDCHMPELPSKAIMVLKQGETVPTSAHMRSHYITVYRDEIKNILLNKPGNKNDRGIPAR
jgi:hypothetical protein